ncbi:MAG: hypothetical protein HYU64_00400 [Armatimonadetes bacterium]|nr:hypothetical protein [Armatimonadota bacterium]
MGKNLPFLVATLVVTLLCAYFADRDLAFTGGVPHGAKIPCEVRILGQSRLLAGSPFAVRVMAFYGGSEKPAANRSFSLVLSGKCGKRTLFSGKTDSLGNLPVHGLIPAQLAGEGTLALFQDDFPDKPVASFPVQVQEGRRILLSTDKPLYQPGQTMHLRALCLSEGTLAPLSGRTLVFEIEDSKGNKVGKHKSDTSRFGVASFAFTLADEVNLGEYHVRAILDDARDEKSVTVKRYVLPKFKIVPTFARSFYLPGETVKGNIVVRYFFGKPVKGAQVEIVVRSFDVQSKETARIQGKTDSEGAFSFEFTVPSYLVGIPLEKGKGWLAVEISATDTAQHKEVSHRSVTVAPQPLVVDIFPEGGSLSKGLSNAIYIMTSYPDGKGAPAFLSGAFQGKRISVHTDAEGFAEVQVTPQSGRETTLFLRVTDSKGNKVEIQRALPQKGTPDSVLIRPDRSLLKQGEILSGTILSTRPSGAVYLDLIQNDQTVLTATIEMGSGRGHFSVPVSSQMRGLMTLHAYQISRDGNSVRDTRRIFVQPSGDLKVAVSLDKKTYRPGESALIGFHVTDPKGGPKVSALGVDIVDESLFYLAEQKPGLERVYFLLEKELLSPGYEIHGFTFPDVAAQSAPVPRKEKLSRALFSQLPEKDLYPVKLDSSQLKRQQMFSQWPSLLDALRRHSTRHGYPLKRAWATVLSQEGLLRKDQILDPWGRPYWIEEFTEKGAPKVLSLGPDGRLHTADDMEISNLYAMRYFELDGRALLRDGIVMNGPMGGAMPVPEAKAEAGEMLKPATSTPTTGAKDQEAPRVREYFPETLYTNPQVITDDRGNASIRVPLADSITTWRLRAFASSLQGEMGYGQKPIRVFQDFFVDPDLPVRLTQGDRISIPVAVYNYLRKPQIVRISLEKDSWFEPIGETVKSLALKPNEVTVAYFPIRATGIGVKNLTITAKGTVLSDAVRRSIEVVPDGEEIIVSKSDRLRGEVTVPVEIPGEAIDGSGKILVTVYPGIFSQVVEGMDALLRMPGGCFEQTSSTTYPNVLVLQYLRKTGKITPEIRMKADGFINAGYQRLLTFEVPGGGFSVFGQAPANPILTAFGLMEFSDMAQVHEVDPALIARTRSWLFSQQDKDGAWGAGRQGFYAEGWSNVPNSALPSTAYITWALLETGDRSPQTEKGANYIAKHLDEARDPYTLALCANALASHSPTDKATEDAVERLLKMRVDEKDGTFWKSTIATAAYSTGTAADIETTALAIHALLRAGTHPEIANRGITWLVQGKDAYGTWHTTQSTVLALRTMILSLEKASEKVDGQVTIAINGVKSASFRITPDNYDVVHQVDLKSETRKGKNTILLTMTGQGNCMFKVAGKYHIPWEKTRMASEEMLDIHVSYDRTELAKADTVTCKVKVRNLSKKTANMVMLDLGVPPGFEVQAGDFDELVGSQKIQKYSLTGRQIVLYLERIEAGKEFTLSYRLKAKYPLRAKTPSSRAYLYYDPKVSAESLPVTLEVR